MFQVFWYGGLYSICDILLLLTSIFLKDKHHKMVLPVNYYILASWEKLLRKSRRATGKWQFFVTWILANPYSLPQF